MSLLKPYYENELVTIYNADCMEILPHIDPVDLVLTDPPYGISKQGKINCFNNNIIETIDYGFLDFDIKNIDKISSKMSTNSSIVLFFDRLKLLNIWNEYVNYGIKPKQIISWLKNNRGINPRKNFNSRIESAVWGVKGDYVWNGGGCTGNVFIEKWCELNNPKACFHPTQKPVALFSWLIDLLTQEKQTVLDPFIGSGTTAVACMELNRKCVGIEFEEKYCEVTAERCENVHPNLFFQVKKENKETKLLF